MDWLVDNNVPRSVSLLLRDKGMEATEVRAVLGQEAQDDAILAYASALRLTIITHDRGLALRAFRADIRHVWLRTPEILDRDRLRDELSSVMTLFDSGLTRVVLFASVIRAA